MTRLNYNEALRHPGLADVWKGDSATKTCSRCEQTISAPDWPNWNATPSGRRVYPVGYCASCTVAYKYQYGLAHNDWPVSTDYREKWLADNGLTWSGQRVDTS